MKNLIFVIVSVCLQQAIANDIIPKTTSCPLNQVYTSCGSACAPTCENYKTPPQFCTMQCIVGCVCKPGYVKKKDGSCCLPEECEPKVTQPSCPLNQEYTSCGSACAPTCENYKTPPQVCTMQCIVGCVCQPGYVKKSDGSCCLPEECEPKVTQPSCALAHEVYNVCGSACPSTCDNYNDMVACTMQCVPGCYCDVGYVRNSDGNCCLPEECEPEVSPSCPLSHQIYTTCGTACPVTCENYNNPPRFCTKQCVIGCICEPGYVKKSDGSCCLPQECKLRRPAGRFPYIFNF